MGFFRTPTALELAGRRVGNDHGQPGAEHSLSPDTHHKLGSIAARIKFPHSGSIIFDQGREASHLYFVCEGVVRITCHANSMRQQVIAILTSGGIFGIPERGMYINSASGLGDVSLYQVPWSSLTALMQSDPDIHGRFLERVAFDFRQTQNRIVALGQQNVTQRLVSFLLDLMKQKDFYDAKTQRLSLPLARADLANYLGTSPETVVRVLAHLESCGLVGRRSSRFLVIISRDELAKLLHGRRRND